MRIVPLGAGQDVGRSCVLVTINNRTIMFDCGMHMGYNDERRFPDFTQISKANADHTARIDAVVITHFHLDHCGALPHFTEIHGYDGPIYMTPPTKAICPILLEDYRKITVERKGETNFFTSQNIKDCLKKVVTMHLHESVWVDDDLELRAYYAGHVLGAAMVYARSGSESVVYTGDYNMTPDRHLGAAWIDRVRPDALITETTYGTTIRDSKRARERDFLEKVHHCVDQGGKVLIPCFALGRAQELCILIETYWERMGLNVPVYFSAGLTEKANRYYKLFINWTNQKVKESFVNRNPFDFKYIKPWSRDYMDNSGPMVVFATPGMLHIGTSLEIFKKWAPSHKNMLIMPGYCVAGTVGAKVLAGDKTVYTDQFTKVDVNMSVQNLSFSAHADAKGIMELIRQAEPRNVVLVHGEKSRMSYLKSKVMSEFCAPCFDPANGEILEIETSGHIPALLSDALYQKAWERKQKQQQEEKGENLHSISELPIEGFLVTDGDGKTARLVDAAPFKDGVGSSRAVGPDGGATSSATQGSKRVVFNTIRVYDAQKVATKLSAKNGNGGDDNGLVSLILQTIHKILSLTLGYNNVPSFENNNAIKIRSVTIKIPSNDEKGEMLSDADSLMVSWEFDDEDLATSVLSVVNRVVG
ncbi:Integrator complex subunit 11 [Mycoemilia scoparia]|uniref:Integrator complex subunit 11 n=1 Tax=Mycoemilia scoparia TaxID=417184 RepID=A0A9W8DW18_9FUNG|nr:Integrator complex subunit 11 [Mycoemilia scoparia]